jgi:hypothetical protein
MLANTYIRPTPFPVCVTHCSYFRFISSSKSLKNKGIIKIIMYDYYTYKKSPFQPIPHNYLKNFPSQQLSPHAQPKRKYNLRVSASDHPVNISSVAFSDYKAKNIF